MSRRAPKLGVETNYAVVKTLQVPLARLLLV